VSFTLRTLYPWERILGTHWVEGWVDPKSSLDDVERRKILPLLSLELRPLGSQALSQSPCRLSYQGVYLQTEFVSVLTIK
jgi:hypothetical protein